MRLVTVRTGQNIFDVALQEYGHAEGIQFLIEDNPTFPLLTTPLIVGKKMQIRPQYKDKVIAQQMKKIIPTHG